MSNFFRQPSTSLIVGWLAGGTGKNHIKSIHSLLNYCVDTQFTNVAVDRVSQSGGLRVGIRGLDRNPDRSFQLALVKGVHKSNKIY